MTRLAHGAFYGPNGLHGPRNLPLCRCLPLLGSGKLGTVSTSSPFDKPIVADKHCKKCGHPLVRFLLTTGYVIYLHCELCGHEWNEPERRKVPRYRH